VAVGEPVLVGGRTIHPGDAIVGDNDGVAVIRPDELEDVVSKALALQEWERRCFALMNEGKSHKEVMKLVGSLP
jgi:4-hydroxy-4-methyl-2-oxoglutarate aldolase